MYFLGIDLGSSSIKLSVLDAESGTCLASVTAPDFEMEIKAPEFGWAEQDPDLWWQYTKQGIAALSGKYQINLKKIKGIGIAYQMHGLVLTDANINPVRPAIIWCDSRAAQLGDNAYNGIGKTVCNETILNSPGNFTAAKIKWVAENQPEILEKAKYMMLPGDFIAAKLSGIAQISESGLSEGTLWNFKENRVATEVLSYMGLSESLIPEVVPSFGVQATVSSVIAQELGFDTNVKITYRGGDQPNNALSLNVLQPGEIATTAGTSAVIYSVTENNSFDTENRVNTFLHVNNTTELKRNGVLLCINGSGILYQWLRKIMSAGGGTPLPYEKLNEFASAAKPGSSGLRFYPFGNGVERIFSNKKATSGIQNLNFNIHQAPELVRAACEGIGFAMNYGFEVMKEIGASGSVVRAGKANLFLSPVFREIFVNTTGTSLELYNTSGAEGAARGAAYGYGYYTSLPEAFNNLVCLEKLDPKPQLMSAYQDIYGTWKNNINKEQ